jgi:hypothetical protein
MSGGLRGFGYGHNSLGGLLLGGKMTKEELAQSRANAQIKRKATLAAKKLKKNEGVISLVEYAKSQGLEIPEEIIVEALVPEKKISLAGEKKQMNKAYIKRLIDAEKSAIPLLLANHHPKLAHMLEFDEEYNNALEQLKYLPLWVKNKYKHLYENERTPFFPPKKERVLSDAQRANIERFTLDNKGRVGPPKKTKGSGLYYY